MKKILRILAIVAMMPTMAAMGKDYYASPTGSGDGSTYEKAGAFVSLIKKLKAGDVMHMLGGQYDYDVIVTVNVNGEEGNVITIEPYNGEEVILDFRKQTYKKVNGSDAIGLKVTGSYLHIKGLTIRYAGKNGLQCQGSYNTFEALDVYGNCDSGIQMKNGGHNLILNCDSHDNFDYENGGISAADFGGNADGFADKQHSAAANTYRGCRAWNNGDDGWDFFQRESPEGEETVIEDCICFNNGPLTYDMRNHPRYETDKEWFDQFTGISVTDRKKVTHTNVTLENYPNIGNGNGFKIGGNQTLNKVKLVRCLAVENQVKGFDQNNNAGEMTLYNCTSYNNGQNYGFGNTNASLVIYNCISLKTKNKDQFSCNPTESKNNSWNTSGVTCNEVDFESLDTDVLYDDRNSKGELPKWTLLKLKAGSSMIDAGKKVDGVSYNGAAPDLGCYETGSNTTGIAAVSREEMGVKIEANGIRASEKVAEIEIVDMRGRTVAKSEGNELSTETLSRGIYVAKLKSEEGYCIVKMQKK